MREKSLLLNKEKWESVFLK